MDELIIQNEKIVKFFANKYYGIASRALVDFDDLVQEGWIAFIKAVEKYRFDDEEPIKFTSYASEVIKYKMLNFINRNICRIKKSDSNSEQIKICSISETIPGTEDITIEEIIVDEQSEEPFTFIEDEIDNEILREDLFDVIYTVLGKGAGLVRNVLIMHYGLKGKLQTFEQIAKKFKVTRQSVQEAEFKAIKKIRNSEAGKALMKKYQWMVFNSLEHDRNKINQFASPDVVLERMETLDDLLYRILKQCN